MDKRIKEITIVGGGTAGWMAATFLVSVLNGRADRHKTKVTLIESPNVPTVGVGEATVPTIPHFLQQLGIKESEFIRRCNASFKLGVRFVGWDHDAKGGPMSYIHPFYSADDNVGGHNPAYYFHRFGGLGGGDTLDDCISPSRALIDNRRGPRLLEDGDYTRRVTYAYHLDAGLFAGFLQEIAVQRGVQHVLDDVDDVEVDDRGFIAALRLRQGGRRPVEFVIDCTGFRGLIIQKVLGVPFESYDRFLLNDRALAVQLPHPDPTRLEPCTRSTALGAGWVWRVPLYSRVGTGYVFSSRFRSDDEAMAEFKAHLGEAGKDAEPRAIGIRVGRLSRAWEKNCVAIGLSSGFIEPLESTAIFMIENAVRTLAANFPDLDFHPSLADHYNAVMDRMLAEIRDFIVLHYCANNRTDSPYWVTAREEMEVPDSARECLERYRHAFPNNDWYDRTFLFNYFSFLVVLFGKGYFDGVQFPAENFIARADWESFQHRLRQFKDSLVASLPDQYALLRRIRGEDQPAAAPWMAGLGGGATVGLGAGAPPPRVQVTATTQVDLGGSNIL
ncbi:MAG: tryptophan 7-halogenase [Hyphomicrobiales bacterium]|nr:tryptophan 7-halogenase [Hyphomicrobiales bacterium]MCP5370692.1 tryptophan 7-halogenase [Hyphomicrobiales bacterium]